MPSGEPVYYVHSGKAKIKNVGNDKALYVEGQKAIHVLNPTAHLIYEAMKDPISFEELMFVIEEVTHGDIKDIQEDLKETIELFMKFDIIKLAE